MYVLVFVVFMIPVNHLKLFKASQDGVIISKKYVFTYCIILSLLCQLSGIFVGRKTIDINPFIMITRIIRPETAAALWVALHQHIIRNGWQDYCIDLLDKKRKLKE